ncbi:MAG: CDP-alcohol phosphatidyltransferase family protein [Elusimicrobia bacterium]|nr:CDP-alcohol phosphatidyltransferase family protein [Elusimicrobiota bacterium]
MSLANKITVIRIVLTPFFLICLVYELFFPAFLFYLASAVTDGLDGFYARRRRQITRIGSFLDPLADKSFLIPTYVYLTQSGQIPKWLFVILLSRDFTVILGWLLNFIRGRQDSIKPRFSGKLSIAVQMVYFLLVMTKLAFPELPSLFLMEKSLRTLTHLTGFFAFLSFVDYLIQGSADYSKTNV